jgi:hypothetical protein
MNVTQPVTITLTADQAHLLRALLTAWAPGIDRASSATLTQEPDGTVHLDWPGREAAGLRAQGAAPMKPAAMTREAR